MRAKIFTSLIIVCGLLLCFAARALALSTEDLLRLHKAGVPEDVILRMVESNYEDVNRVLKLKEAGFKDESILAIINSDLKTRVAPEATTATDSKASGENIEFTTRGRVKILWYMIYREKPVLQNSQALKNVKISVLNNRRIKFEWGAGGLGLLDELFKKPFASPFYWDINKDDALVAGQEGYRFALQSYPGHQGEPDSDDSHYWMILLDPEDPKLADLIK